MAKKKSKLAAQPKSVGLVEPILPPGKSFVHDNRTKDIVEGTVLRFLVSNGDHPDFGKWNYGIATGGFGLRASALGNAIFVDAETTDVAEAERIIHMSKTERLAYGRSLPNVDEIKTPEGTVIRFRPDSRSTRWERYWHLEILSEAEESNG